MANFIGSNTYSLVSSADTIITQSSFVPGVGPYTPATYPAVAGSGGAGSGFLADVVVDALGIVSVTPVAGTGYAIGNTITIDGGSIGGAAGPGPDDVTVTIDGVVNPNYIPGALGSPISVNGSWVMGIHILDTLTAPVDITHAGSGYVTTFPVGSLIKGAIYYYSVKEIVLDAADAGKILGIAPMYKSSIF